MKFLPTLISIAIFSSFSNPVKSEEMRGTTKASASKAASAQEIKLQKAATVSNQLTAKQQSQVLKLLNEGTEENLIAVKGIAASRTKSIISARPFNRIEDLVKIRGIGLSTFGQFLEYGKNPSQQTATSES